MFGNHEIMKSEISYVVNIFRDGDFWHHFLAPKKVQVEDRGKSHRIHGAIAYVQLHENP